MNVGQIRLQVGDLFFNKIRLIISEKVRLKIIKYDTGFVSRFIVLLKLNKSRAIKIDAIIGSPGISQVRFNNIAIKQVKFNTQVEVLLVALENQE